jgi:ketosteroid isomerase-like protein
MSAIHSESTTAIESAIIAADVVRIRAVLGRDRAGLEAIMDDDLVYVHSSGAQESKAVYIDRVVGGTYDYKDFVIDTRSFRHAGGLVFVNGDNKVDIVRGGELLHLAGRYLMVWRGSGVSWRLHTFHAAPIPRVG